VRQFKKYRENKSVRAIVFRVEHQAVACSKSGKFMKREKTRDAADQWCFHGLGSCQAAVLCFIGASGL